MPELSLIVCLHKEADLLERLIVNSHGCYDELLVVHDGPDEQNIKAIVEEAGGRFFEMPRAFQQEPHMPFAFSEAKNDWVLHLDADEFPGPEMKKWLTEFRNAPEPSVEAAGYTCVWPLWNGKRAITQKWPRGRIFLFHKGRVRFFGMVEQAVVPDGKLEELEIVLCHQPKRIAYGLWNIVNRPRAKRWREVIARSLIGKPTDLPCWRWNSEAWPPEWEAIRRHPFRTAISRLLMGTLRRVRDQWRFEKRLLPGEAISGPLHHALICLEYWKLRHVKNHN